MPGLLPFLLVSLVIASLLRIDFFFTILYLLLIVYLFSRLWVWRLSRDLKATRSFDGHAYLGDRTNVIL